MWNAPITTLVKVYEECIYAKVKKVAISASLLGLSYLQSLSQQLIKLLFKIKPRWN